MKLIAYLQEKYFEEITEQQLTVMAKERIRFKRKLVNMAKTIIAVLLLLICALLVYVFSMGLPVGITRP